MKREREDSPHPGESSATAGESPGRGLECRKCGCKHFFVIYTRAREESIMRRRECRNCGRRITTWEKTLG